MHKTPVVTDRAFIRVVAQKANATLCQHPLDQGDTVLEGMQDDGQVPVAPVIQAAVEARGREVLYIINAMVTVWKQCLPQADDHPAINQRCHMAKLASDTPVGPGPLVRPEVELRLCQPCDLTRDEVVQLLILWKEHGTRGVVSDSL